MYYTPEQKRDNREKLAEYLANLPKDYVGFEMGDFFQSLDLHAKRSDYWNDKIPYAEVKQALEEAKKATIKYARENGGVAQCGAVACAVGHGPSAGFLLRDRDFARDGNPDWSAYAARVFLDKEYHDLPDDSGLYNYRSDDFAWMFGGSWSVLDNTPHGAAARIRYFNEKGLPDDFDEEDVDSLDPALYSSYLR